MFSGKNIVGSYKIIKLLLCSTLNCSHKQSFQKSAFSWSSHYSWKAQFTTVRQAINSIFTVSFKTKESINDKGKIPFTNNKNNLIVKFIGRQSQSLLVLSSLNRTAKRSKSDIHFGSQENNWKNSFLWTPSLILFSDRLENFKKLLNWFRLVFLIIKYMKRCRPSQLLTYGD